MGARLACLAGNKADRALGGAAGRWGHGPLVWLSDHPWIAAGVVGAGLGARRGLGGALAGAGLGAGLAWIFDRLAFPRHDSRMPNLAPAGSPERLSKLKRSSSQLVKGELGVTEPVQAREAGTSGGVEDSDLIRAEGNPSRGGIQ